MRALQALVRNGNSTQVTIPRAMLMAADLITGQRVMLTLNEDKSITIRLPESEDFLPARSGIMRHIESTGGQR
jgi:antitoxin component of MazEF toxin-antitoxin module